MNLSLIEYDKREKILKFCENIANLGKKAVIIDEYINKEANIEIYKKDKLQSIVTIQL